MKESSTLPIPKEEEIKGEEKGCRDVVIWSSRPSSVIKTGSSARDGNVVTANARNREMWSICSRENEKTKTKRSKAKTACERSTYYAASLLKMSSWRLDGCNVDYWKQDLHSWKHPLPPHLIAIPPPLTPHNFFKHFTTQFCLSDSYFYK